MARRVTRRGPPRPPARRPRVRRGPRSTDLVIVSQALADLAAFLRERQASAGRGRVILDRRAGDRRRDSAPVAAERRRRDRRLSASNGAEALMRVLGFTVAPGSGRVSGPSGRSAARGLRRGRR